MAFRAPRAPNPNVDSLNRRQAALHELYKRIPIAKPAGTTPPSEARDRECGAGEHVSEE